MRETDSGEVVGGHARKARDVLPGLSCGDGVPDHVERTDLSATREAGLRSRARGSCRGVEVCPEKLCNLGWGTNGRI